MAEKRERHGLVITRARDASVMIGDDIEVTVVEVGGGKARLMFSAPKEVAVWRREIWESMQQEKASAPAVEVKA